jgi:hypothetical protein
VILDFLVAQLNQRFQHEKRARVCLWFDERQEFSRLLPPLRVHLDAMKQPPFRLLEYDAGEKHGQIWLKYQIHRALEQAALEARKHLRFVLYLPLPEERLDSPSENGDPPLNLLAEYRLTGVMWRIGGKRPTLFTFLRQASAALSDNPAAQRRLYEGGRDSLLAKYVAKFIDRPAVFWATTLTPELTASRLIGDVDQTILDLAVDPETTWKDLRDKGLGREFLDSVRERYGFEGPDDSPADWVRELVAVLALTETYLGYGEPPDFPFTERLPSLALRPHHVQLLQRWLRDSESRAAWDPLGARGRGQAGPHDVGQGAGGPLVRVPSSRPAAVAGGGVGIRGGGTQGLRDNRVLRAVREPDHQGSGVYQGKLQPCGLLGASARPSRLPQSVRRRATMGGTRR